jgi:hypothetical protein
LRKAAEKYDAGQDTARNSKKVGFLRKKSFEKIK